MRRDSFEPERPRRSSRYAAWFVFGMARFGANSLRTRRGLSIVGASLANADPRAIRRRELAAL